MLPSAPNLETRIMLVILSENRDPRKPRTWVSARAGKKMLVALLLTIGDPKTKQRAHDVKGRKLNECSSDGLVQPAGSSCSNGSTNVPGVQDGLVDDCDG